MRQYLGKNKRFIDEEWPFALQSLENEISRKNLFQADPAAHGPFDDAFLGLSKHKSSVLTSNKEWYHSLRRREGERK